MSINFTDHVRYDEAANATEKLANVSEEFFNWSGRTVVVLNKSIVDPDRKSSLNIPLVCFKFLACLTVVIPLTFLILRQLTRSILLPKLEDSSASLRGRAALSSSNPLDPAVKSQLGRVGLDAPDSPVPKTPVSLEAQVKTDFGLDQDTLVFVKRVSEPTIPPVPCIPGKDLGEGVDTAVRALAAKDILLPKGHNREAYERAKAAMGAVLVDPLEKRVFQKVTDHLKHITFTDLTRGLQHIIPQFNEAIGSTPFTAVTINGKSNEWVTQIALHEGLTPPTMISQQIPFCGLPVYTPVVTIMDDASYSGSQIAHLIRDICQATKEASLHPEVFPFPPTPVTQFLIMVPFITKQAEARILEAAAGNGIEVKIISSGTMPDYKEVLTAEEATCFARMTALNPNSRGTTLAYTDWRRPDIASSPEAFLAGTMHYTTDTGEQAVYKGPPLVPSLSGPYKN